MSSCTSQQSSWPKSNPFSANKLQSIDQLKKISGKKSTQIVYNGNLSGELSTCGCAIGPKGGLERRLNFLVNNKMLSSPIVLDAGNALFTTAKISKNNQSMAQSNALKILKAHKKMGVQAQNVGYLDLSLGIDFLQKNMSSFLVSSNIVNLKGEPIFSTHKKIKEANGQLWVLGLSDPGAHKNNKGYKLLDPQKTIEKWMKKIPKQDQLVVLSDLEVNTIEKIAQQNNRAIVFIESRSLGSLQEAQHVAQSIRLRTQLQGQEWGVIELIWSPKGSAWLNPDKQQLLSKRFSQLDKDYQYLQQQEKSSDRKSEITRLLASLEKIKKYAPQSSKAKSNAIFYKNKLYPLTDKYAGKNELSSMMN